MDIFRDTIWQFVGVVLALVSIFVTVYFSISQYRKKSLVYVVMAETPLLTVNEELKSKIQVLYQDKPIQDVHLIVLKILNSGQIPILEKDFESSLTFQFGKTANILSAEIIETSPASFSPTISFQDTTLSISPTLFNSKDMVAIKILAAQYNGNITASARIVGVSEIKRTGEYSLSEDIAITKSILPAVPVLLFSILLFSIATSRGISARWGELLIFASFFSMGSAITFLITRLLQVKSKSPKRKAG